MEHIEEKEIRGVSFKTVRWLIGCTIFICLSLAGSYYGIQNKLGMITNNSNNKNVTQDLRIKTNEVSISIIRTKLDALQVKINRLTIEVEKIKAGVN